MVTKFAFTKAMIRRLVLCALLGALAAGVQTNVAADGGGTCPLDGKNCTDSCTWYSSGCECNQVDCNNGTCIYSGCSTYCCQETCNGGTCGI